MLNRVLNCFFKPKRKLHVYCVGLAKTGTSSVASMFIANFRSEHEKDIQNFNSKMIQYLKGEVSRDFMEKFILKRDREFLLDVESSHPMAYVVELLVGVFPEAKFIVTIREPYNWLASRLNFHHEKVNTIAFKEYRDYFWMSRQGHYEEQELVLKKYNLCSLDIYLSQYVDHYRRVFSAVPKDRLLTVRTDELGSSIGRIANFVGVSEKLLQKSHSNKVDVYSIRPLEEMNEDYVRKKIWFHCEGLINEYFPDSLEDYQ